MKKAFFIILSAGILVLLYPLIHTRSVFLQKHFKTYNLSDRFLQQQEPEQDSISMDSAVVVMTNNPASRPEPYSGTNYLAAFFESLAKKNNQTRIAYYGDSSIEGDLITQTVRDSLQRKFGGDGVGFVPVSTHLSGFRRSVYVHFSEDWTRIKMNKPVPPAIPLGYLGMAYTCNIAPETPSDTLAVDSVSTSLTVKEVPDSTEMEKTDSEPEDRPEFYSVRYAASKSFPGTRRFSSARLFYSAPIDSSDDKGNVMITIGDNNRTLSLNGNSVVNELLLSSHPISRIQLDFDSICSQVIYGVSLESKQGVIVDNLPFRGNSGSWLTRIRTGVLNAFQQKLGVDLVVLQYGLNVLNTEMTDYSWYATEMKQVISHIQKGFPGASILVIGPADRAVKMEGTMQTDPSIPRITKVLRKVSEEKKVAFFSFYEAMGGKGSMVEWVEANSPRLANLDYTHFNFQGAEKAGELLLTYLMEAYMDYLENNKEASNHF